MENEILFENVSFSYDGKEVFRNLNVRIPSDRHVALVGERIHQSERCGLTWHQARKKPYC